MELLDYMKIVLIFSVFVGGLNGSGLYAVDVDTLPGVDYNTMNDSVAQLIDAEGSGTGVVKGDKVNILDQSAILISIFWGAMKGVVYLYGPLINMGMPEMLAAIIQAVLSLSEVAFLIQIALGRYFKSIET